MVTPEEMREACAKIADEIGATVETGPGGDCVEGCSGIAERIAASIRAGKVIQDGQQ